MSLAVNRYDAMEARIVDALTRAKKNYGRAVQRALHAEAKEIAKCSLMQRRRLLEAIDRVGLGFNLGNFVDKIVLEGLGQMAPHVTDNNGITAKTFKNLPAKDQKILNDPNATIAIAKRNRVVYVPTPKLTPKDTYKAIPACEAKSGIRTPSMQHDPCPNVPAPVYHLLVGDALSGKDIILVGQLNDSVVKLRITPPNWRRLKKKYP